jgi:hypothetical protein
MALELRMAENERDAVLVFRAYKQMHEEGLVPGALNERKLLFRVLGMVKTPGSVVLMVMDGDTLAGVISLYEQSYWYSDDRHLIDKGLYVVPEYRDGAAFDMLLDAAKSLSDDLGIPCFLFIFNAKRKRGGQRSGWERAGATLGYTNRGAILAHHPET